MGIGPRPGSRGRLARTGAGLAAAAADDLNAARDRIENLAQTMLQLRTERDSLRAQLLQARDQLAKAQQRQAAGEKDQQAAVAAATAKAAGLEKDLAATKGRADELAKAQADQPRAHAGGRDAALAKAKAEADESRAEAEKRLAAEAETLKGRLDQAKRENAELRSVATASVEEVKNLSDQL